LRLTTGDTGGEDGFTEFTVLTTEAVSLEALTRLQVKGGREFGW
jgi:hypothetical protein